MFVCPGPVSLCTTYDWVEYASVRPIYHVWHRMDAPSLLGPSLTAAVVVGYSFYSSVCGGVFAPTVVFRSNTAVCPCNLSDGSTWRSTSVVVKVVTRTVNLPVMYQCDSLGAACLSVTVAVPRAVFSAPGGVLRNPRCASCRVPVLLVATVAMFRTLKMHLLTCSVLLGDNYYVGTRRCAS